MRGKIELLREMTKVKKVRQQEHFCEMLFETIEDYFCLDADFVSAKTRKREFVYARQIAMYLLDKHTEYSLTRIGKMFNNKDHATVYHAKKMITGFIQTNRTIKSEVNDIETIVLSKLNLLSKKQTPNPSYYYINFDNYTSIRLSDNKGILLTGYTKQEIMQILFRLEMSSAELRIHENTGHYILEKLSNNSDTNVEHNEINLDKQ